MRLPPELPDAEPHSRRSHHLAVLAVIFAVGLGAAATSAAAADSSPPRQVIAPLVTGDEPIVVAEHTIQAAGGPLTYETQTGRLPIRNAETGEVQGYIFFAAYRVKTKDEAKRPVTFLWNGGPGVPSSIIHLGGLGPRIMAGDHMEDNPETLLRSTDLVFMDAMETGFSRLADPKFEPAFFTLRGDVAATAEFIRAFRTRLRATDQPVFIAGESFGVFRAAALTDFMTDRGDRLDGTILISGDFPNVPQPVAFYDAMHIPARTATAFYYKRLDPDLMKDRAATMKAALDWATNVYQPALEHLDTLSDAEKDKIVAGLVRYTGVKAEQVDRKVLFVGAEQYLANFFGGDPDTRLGEEDTRQFQVKENLFGSPETLDHYFRDELGYDTNLTYSVVEKGYQPTPGPKLRSAGSQMNYDVGMPSADYASSLKYGEVTWTARDNPTWTPNALARDRTLRVFVATGRFDPLNMCEGDVREVAQLPAGEAARIENHCYESGHVVYADPAARHAIQTDLSRFITETVAASSAKNP